MASTSGGRDRLTAADQVTAPIKSSRVTSTRVVTDRSRRLNGAYRFPLVVGLVHLAIVQIAASLAYRYGSATRPSPPFQQMPAPHTGLSHWIVDPLRQWDGLWYRLVAIDGYGKPAAKAAFWPLYPWSMKYVGEATNTSVDVIGWLIANIAFVLALILLYRLVALDFGEGIARTTLWALALFPTALFFTAVYTESLFLLGVVACLLAARHGQWWIAGVAGALAALTRSYGMFLVFPLLVLLLQQRGTSIRRWIPDGITVGFPLIGPAIFSWHLDRTLGDPWAWRNVQEQWNRYSAMPWETLRYAFSQSPAGARIGVRDGADWTWLHDLITHPGWSLVTSEPWRKAVADSDTLELVCTLLFLGLAIFGLYKLPLYQSVYLWPGLLVPLFQPSSVHARVRISRFGLTLFPLFIVIALLVHGRFYAKPLAILSTLLLIFFTIQFAQWYWVS